MYLKIKMTINSWVGISGSGQKFYLKMSNKGIGIITLDG